MDSKELTRLRELVEFLKANEIAEFDVEKGDLKLRLKFAGATAGASAAAPSMDMMQLARLMSSAQPPSAPPSTAVHELPAQQGVAQSEQAAPSAAKNHVVKSPIVGTFYDAPSPGSPPFVKVGDTVEVGQVLCIVEAMKLMNEIESDAAGEIIERIASSAQPVEYGQSLFAIKTK